MILNIKILIFKQISNNIWIQPASGYACSALGDALVSCYEHFNNPWKVYSSHSMKGTYIGFEFFYGLNMADQFPNKMCFIIYHY